MRLLVTAGPTRERLDPVRFLSNRSSGRMGYALAAAAVECGWEVILVSGPVSLTPPAGLFRFESVESAAQMADAVKSIAPSCDAVIMAAAVADYRPAQVSEQKIKKLPGDLVLKLERTEDILAALGAAKPSGQTLIGFAAETEELLAHAREKLQRKNLDWICANTVESGFGTATNAVTLLGRDGETIALPSAPKEELARQILRIVLPNH